MDKAGFKSYLEHCIAPKAKSDDKHYAGTSINKWCNDCTDTESVLDVDLDTIRTAPQELELFDRIESIDDPSHRNIQSAAYKYYRYLTGEEAPRVDVFKKKYRK